MGPGSKHRGFHETRPGLRGMIIAVGSGSGERNETLLRGEETLSILKPAFRTHSVDAYAVAECGFSLPLPDSRFSRVFPFER